MAVASTRSVAVSVAAASLSGRPKKTKGRREGTAAAKVVEIVKAVWTTVRTAGSGAKDHTPTKLSTLATSVQSRISITR